MNKKHEREGEQLVARNARATQRYTIEDRIECGIVLLGTEVKALRTRGADLEGSYAAIERGEFFAHGVHIPHYGQTAVAFQHDTKRSRKLLAHAHEIEKLSGRLTLRGYTLVPLRLYFKNGRAKLELGLGKGKDVGDKREDLRAKAAERERRAALSVKKTR